MSNIKKFDWSHVAQSPPSISVRYLEEANICLEQGAFRMSVVASACALNYGLDFVLRIRGLVNTKKVLTLHQIIGKIKQCVSEYPFTVLSQIQLDKLETVNFYRNAFAHPENFLILKRSSRINVYEMKPKMDSPKDKGEAYIASQYDLKKKLKPMAEESLDFAYNTIREALEKITLP